MEALRTTAGSAHSAMSALEQAFQEKASALRAQQSTMNEVIRSALAQGRSQYSVGSAERGVIDAIPHDQPRPGHCTHKL